MLDARSAMTLVRMRASKVCGQQQRGSVPWAGVAASH
jgi:hypothetical protein